VPAAFHSNFLAGQRFLAALEAYCTTQVQVLQFRGSTAYAAFAKKWNLPVYFSLQFQVGCCALLCWAVLCCAVPCCAVPCRAVPCCAVPCCAVLCCAARNTRRDVQPALLPIHSIIFKVAPLKPSLHFLTPGV
jgi:hypothetical protein